LSVYIRSFWVLIFGERRNIVTNLGVVKGLASLGSSLLVTILVENLLDPRENL
jgi:hypothetical protein